MPILRRAIGGPGSGTRSAQPAQPARSVRPSHPARPLRRAALAVAGVLGGAALLAGAVVGARKWLSDRDVYAFPRTMFGPALVYTVEGDNGEPVRVLNVRGTYQSATYLGERYTEPVFAYYRAFDAMFGPGVPVDVRNVLMIGGGGYAYPKHLIATQPEVRIDVVEIDPVITSIAERYFYLDRLIVEYETEETGRLGLICADGRAYLDELAASAGERAMPEGGRSAAGERADDQPAAGGRAESEPEAPGGPYDAIVLDSFGGREHVPALVSLEATRAARACLNPGGLMLANIVAPTEGPGTGFLRSYVATLGEAFAHVHVVPVTGDGASSWGEHTSKQGECDNTLVIATDSECSFPGEAELFARVSGGAPVLHDPKPGSRR